MSEFQFHGDLFVCRQQVLILLADNGFQWLNHFRAVDVIHELYGLEVTGIAHELEAEAIEKLLQNNLEWNFVRRTYEDRRCECGWKVRISRRPEIQHPAMLGKRPSILAHVWNCLLYTSPSPRD